MSDLKQTPLHALHVELGARMVPFAGYDMPVQYPSGIVAEHNHTRTKAGLFDVSHMGQAHLIGPDHETVAAAFEKLVPGEIAGLERGCQRYTQLTNAEGGILDDLMVTRLGEAEDDGSLYMVVNAACKQGDYDWIRAHLPHGIHLEEHTGYALIALQGPAAEAVLSRHCEGVAQMKFMHTLNTTFKGVEVQISRSGYTGEDGYEISLPDDLAEDFARTLLAEDEVAPIGLGARDSLRLEAGLCLYGHDIDETISPVEAGLLWSIGKRRRTQGGFIGEERIMLEIEHGPARKRVGLKPDGRAPAREGTVIFDQNGVEVGTVTSGGFGPTVKGPVAMGLVCTEFAVPGTRLDLMVRGKPMPATVTKLPFVPHNFKR